MEAVQLANYAPHLMNLNTEYVAVSEILETAKEKP